jgi:hypothetical protein
LHEKVVDPVVAVQRLLAERPYLTRLYTTMSPAEMTMDPMFTFNADLANVSNVHIAKQVVSCSAGVTESNAPWTIELPQGDAVTGRGETWPFAIDALPANRRIEQLAETGQPKVVEDNSQAISSALRKAGGSSTPGRAPNLGFPSDPASGSDSNASPSSGSDGGCAVHAAGAGGVQEQRSLFAFALLALAGLARRRR